MYTKCIVVPRELSFLGQKGSWSSSSLTATSFQERWILGAGDSLGSGGKEVEAVLIVCLLCAESCAQLLVLVCSLTCRRPFQHSGKRTSPRLLGFVPAHRALEDIPGRSSYPSPVPPSGPPLQMTEPDHYYPPKRGKYHENAGCIVNFKN